MTSSPPVRRSSISQAVGDFVHRQVFFGPGLCRMSWPLLEYAHRNRPVLQALERTLHLHGDVIECGVFWGRSIIPIARRLQRAGRNDKTVFALDSFNGFRDDLIERCDLGPNRTLEVVRRRFRQSPEIVPNLRRLARNFGVNLSVVPGFFEETLAHAVEGRRFSFVHLDCDIRSAYQTCLPLLYPRLVEGGVMLFDEYQSPIWPGATEAIDEFLADKPEKPERLVDESRRRSPKYCIVKQATAAEAVRSDRERRRAG